VSSIKPARPEWQVKPETPLQFLRGVGEGRARLLETAGLTTVYDLLYFFPFRYEDRRLRVQIADLRKIDRPVTLRGRVVSAGSKISAVRRLKIFEAILDDGTGTIMVVWFNQPYLADKIKRGDQIAIYGQPRLDKYGRLQIESPDYERIDEAGDSEEEGNIVPVYSSVASITPKVMRRIVSQALPAVAHLEDPLPPAIRQILAIGELQDAIVRIHRPAELDETFLSSRSPAHLRVILQEFFAFQLALRVRRASEESRPKGRTIVVDDAMRAEVRRILPFRLTGAQKRVTKEIADDLRREKPMYRLLQGDVGSGKTIVALIAAVIAIRNGHQVALLAPTEILAEQHYQRIRQLVGSSLRIAKGTGSMSAGERRTLIAGLREGVIDLVVGTHAILEEKIVFKSLGLAIVDEQHRFGVEQRQKLFEKGDLPDILVMTATPIPRSLALALYGDLELSVIDELPPGRQAIKTAVRGAAQIEKVYRFIDEQLAEGAQAYVVYPLIEESEKIDLTPLSQGFETLRQRFPGRSVAMLHGRMPSTEKEETMQRYKQGEIDLLVSTTVIEVGIDVGNASMMLIMDADRFGLSQLHQLRGRVGRGTRKSYCVLIRDERSSEEAKQRLRLFEGARNGFDVAEKDLEIRGAGDFLGTRQSGIPKFRFGNIVRDHALMERARDAAIGYLESAGLPAAVALVGELIGGGTKHVTRD
jgi:ATP-dependent DNA helicase RecG